MGAGGDAGNAIKKPQTDKLVYGSAKLPNELEVLLISDPTADKASAAMDVNVGSMSDPEELPGLAHFLEHMLFYSSEKYPEEDAYSKFISEHGGSTNAFTAAEDTNYHFDVNHEHLEPALDRFAQFFLCPLISEDGVDREVNAVDSEHGKNLNSDAWRFSRLWKSESNRNHPFSHFSTGSLETLMTHPKARGIDSHQALRDFAAQRYSSNIMRLVIYGRESVDDLKALAASKFGAVQNKGLAGSNFTGDAVLPHQLKTLIRVVPQKETDSLCLQWPIPPEQRLHRSRPSGYLGHLLGHEGQGSVFAALKSRGWASELYAGESGLSFSGQSFFEVGITLTKEGQKHAREVTGLVFDYIRLLQQPGGISQERFEEMRALAQMRFNFSDKIRAGRLTSLLAQTLQHVPPEDCLLAAHHVPLDFDPAAIGAALAELTPDKLRILWSSKEFKGLTSETEEVYGTEFSREQLPEEWIDHWKLPDARAGLHLPNENPFVPTNFTMLEKAGDSSAVPSIVHDSDLVKLWYKRETGFEAPKAAVYVAFASPEAYNTPENAVLTRLLVKLVSDQLNETSYEAELAGLSYGIQNTASGFLLTFSGYNHKIMELIRQVTSRLVTADFKEDRFKVQKEAVGKEYANLRYEQPYQTAIYQSSVILELKRWHFTEYEAVLETLELSDLNGWVPRLFKRLWVQAFATGNLTEKEAVAIATYVEGSLKAESQSQPLFPSQRPESRVIKLQPGKMALLQMPVLNNSNENSAIILTYQIGSDNLERNVLGELLVQATKQEAFHRLRSQQQLGYIVFLSAWSNLTVRSLVFILQSSTHAAAVLEQRCEEFLVESAAAVVRNMDDTEFERQKQELAKSKLEKPTRLREQAAKEWREISDGTLIFGRPEAEVKALLPLKKEDLISFFEETMLKPQRRKKLSVHIQGQKSTDQSSGSGSAVAASAPKAAENGASGALKPAKNEAPKPAENEAPKPAENGAPKPAENGAPEPAGDRATGSKSEKAAVVDMISDIWAFKRRQEVYPSPS